MEKKNYGNNRFKWLYAIIGYDFGVPPISNPIYSDRNTSGFNRNFRVCCNKKQKRSRSQTTRNNTEDLVRC